MIRSRCMLNPRAIVSSSFEIVDLESLVAVIEAGSHEMRRGLTMSGSELDYKQLLRDRNPLAFSEVLGGHIADLSFTEVIQRLPSPAHYVATAGFAFWADLALAIYGAYMLRGDSVFSSQEGI